VDTDERLAAKFRAIFPHLDERQRRLLAAKWVSAKLR
jgi:hypothetical protein